MMHKDVCVLLREGFNEKDWKFFRDAPERIFWPKLEKEYQEEIQGIAEGVARGYRYDKIDITVLNANIELASYYVPWLANKIKQDSLNNQAPGKCSAFIANGQLHEGRKDRHRTQQLERLHRR